MIHELGIAGIVLEATGDAPGQYRRVGSFDFKYDIYQDDYHPFLEVLEESGTEVAKTASAKTIMSTEHPEEQYIITIV